MAPERDSLSAPATRPSSSNRLGTSRTWWILIGMCVALTIVLACWLARKREAASPVLATFPLTPLSTSRFRNTTADAHYVGSEACIGCHQGSHRSYGHTGMSQSAAQIVPDQEPPDGVFNHAASNRRYRVYRKEGRLYHQELLLTKDHEELVLADFPVKYVIGSGRHARTYLIEEDGFLLESPITWYAARQRWDMSPGYDKPGHPGFERAMTEGCLFCHVSRMETLDGGLGRVRLDELPIGCERCHGPGSLHVQGRENQDPSGRSRERFDATIVNPKRLGRDLAEAVCQQCHLQSSALIPARGRRHLDFRPGLPLEDFRFDYQLDVPDAPMTVVGHVEQMHLSRCYQVSGSLTCTTCHNPHDFPEAKERVTYYRAICLNCHGEDRCTGDVQARGRKSPDNDCVSCHMPKVSTEIAHLAFTQHRIGIHREVPGQDLNPSAAALRLATLKPLHVGSRHSAIDRKRSLALAYMDVADAQEDPGAARQFYQRAGALLHEVRTAGLRDPKVEGALCWLSAQQHPEEALDYASNALSLPGLSPVDRCNALYVLAREEVRQGNLTEAVERLQQLTRLRWLALDWVMLGNCEAGRGNLQEAVRAWEKAVRMNSRLQDVHRRLAEVYRRAGDPERAARHQRRAEQPSTQ